MKTALVLACDDNYIPYTAVVARRIAHHATREFPIVVVSDRISPENKRLAQSFCQNISFIDAGHLLDGMDLPERGAFTRAAYLRLFLDDILSDFDQALYLDSDLSPLVDVSPLLETKLLTAPVAAAYDLPIMVTRARQPRLGMTGSYFNSGVLVLDLQAIRSERIFPTALSFAMNNQHLCKGADQDPLNAVLDGRWQVLDWRWNVLTYMNDLLPARPFIRHFAGRKPWSINKTGIEPEFVVQWRSDLDESPWSGKFSEETVQTRIARLSKSTEPLVRKAKTIIYSNAAGRRGRKSRLLSGLPETLSKIEAAAASTSMSINLGL